MGRLRSGLWEKLLYGVGFKNFELTAARADPPFLLEAADRSDRSLHRRSNEFRDLLAGKRDGVSKGNFS